MHAPRRCGTPLLFRLVDESRVWVDATLLPGTLPRLTAGDPATIVFDGKSLTGWVQRGGKAKSSRSFPRAWNGPARSWSTGDS